MVEKGARSTFKYPFPVSSGIDKRRMYRLIERFWKLNRSAVSPDTDLLVDYLCSELNARTVEAKSSAECLTWRVPKRWWVRKGQLRKKNGTIIADFADNPLHLWTHSISFVGEVKRDELIQQHIYTDQKRPHEIPYHYRNGYKYEAREWGFSLSYQVVEKLADSVYEVEIDADLDDEGSLKVVDAFLPGELKDTIFIMAHTCHPALVSDGIANIAIAVELYHYLSSLPKRRFSYRFIFGPEYFAAAVFLANAESETIKNLTYGVFLDMLSSHEPIGFQHSMQGDSRMDKIVRNILASHVETFLERPFRGLWGNDEAFYNGPGFNIPTVGLGRGMHREYHYDTDNIENMNMYHMQESAWILSRIVEIFETDYVPLRRYNGPLYLSRFDLYVDPTKDHLGARNLDRIQVLMDGERSCMDIAETMNTDFFLVLDLCDRMEEKRLIDKSPRLSRERDQGTLV